MKKQNLNLAERKAYRELFINRDDVYKRQKPKGDGYFDVHEQLTDEILFNPNENVGSYQLDKNSKIRYAVLDIDLKKSIYDVHNFKVEEWLPILQQQAKIANDLLKAMGIDAITEFSGFKGYHVWIFLIEPTDASIIRQFMQTTFADMPKVHDGIAWELFPKQDQVGSDGYGSYIKPPLQIHKKSMNWSYFVDSDFNEVEIDLTKISKTDGLLLTKAMPSKQHSTPPPNMENMFERCSMLRDILSEAESDKLTGALGHEKRLFLASLLKPFGKRGYIKLTEILKNVGDYDEKTTKNHWDSLNRAPVTCEKYCKYFPCDESKRLGGKSPIKLAWDAPIDFVEKKDCYFKNGKQISTFIIRPKELLVLKDSDCLICDVQSSMGYSYKDVQLENIDWHARTKFLKAIGHQDCTFLGSDNDLQALCSYISYRTPMRKIGTKITGIIGDVWVVDGLNITKGGLNDKPDIVPYEKGNDAFYKKIKYNVLDQGAYVGLVQAFYQDIDKINDVDVIYPMLGWFFASPLKELISAKLDGFPILFVHGGQGSGKTTTGRIFLRLAGYNETKPNSCTMRAFPMLKLLSSTNAIPVLLDEFKVSDMSSEQYENLLRFMRKSYFGEVEQKGRADQTVEEYHLIAPLIVMGEWNISMPALKERFILVRFTDIVKKTESMQLAYERIKNLNLEAIMPYYVQFCLNNKIKDFIDEATDIVNKHFASISVAPRIKNNLVVMVIGLLLYQKFASYYKINIDDVDYGRLLDSQLSNITDSKIGYVRSAVDQLIEELGVMASNGVILNGCDYKFLTVEGKTKALAITFNKILPRFKEYAWKTKYEGELLDKASFYSLFKETSYVMGYNTTVKFGNESIRCLIINLEKAIEAGISMEGFRHAEVLAA